MIIEPRVVHDLKTERDNVAPPLPTYMRMVPIAFYLSAFGCVVLSAVFMLQLVKERNERDGWKERTTVAKADLDRTKTARAGLEAEAKRASEFLAWIEGSRMVQPLVVSITRSMNAKAEIAELGLARNEETPSQINLKLKLLTDNPEQLDAILDAVVRDGFRAYSAQQRQDNGMLNYEATLIWQNSSHAIAAEPATTPPKPAAK